MSPACPQCGRRHSEFDPRCLDCGAPLPTLTGGAEQPAPRRTPLSPGGRLGRFEILGELGRGGMGVVYRARDLELGREVALKLLTGAERDAADRARVMREARVLAALDHPAIGTLYEVGAGPHGSFLVLALYSGRTLAAELQERGALPPAEAAAILGQLAGALAAAHGAGILHRDVKPSNVFRLPEGQVKLLDFGIARGAESGDGSASGDGQRLGTAAYMAPERLLGKPSGSAADVWSLGVLGWELATGSHPFDLSRPGWLERAAAARPDPPLLPAALPMPAALAALLASCLALEPLDRPGAAALAGGLADLGEALRRTATPPSRRRRRVLAAGLAAALAALAAAAAWRKPARPLRVALLEPKVEGQLAVADRQRLVANLEAASRETLARLRGLETLHPDPAHPARGATEADEKVGWEASCPGVDLCSARLFRRDAAGRVLGSESLELSASGDTLTAQAAAAALRRLYGELEPRDGADTAQPKGFSSALRP